VPIVADIPITPSDETAKSNGKSNGQNAQQVQPTTTEDINNRETVEKLALRIWAATVAETVLSAVSGHVDELIQPYLLDDDDEEADEEADENRLDDHYKRELAEAIADGLDKYPDINAVNDLSPSPDLLKSDPDIVQAVGQLKNVLAKCLIGATKLRDICSRSQLERRVMIELEKQFKNNSKYREHMREDVPGRGVKKYGSRGRTSSKGTFYKSVGYLVGGGFAALFTGGWIRVCKDRIDPIAWSHQYGMERKTERQTWYRHFHVTERSGRLSPHKLAAEKLTEPGTSAIQQLIGSGVLVVAGTRAQRGLVRFLKFRPKQEIIRMPRVGWAQIDDPPYDPTQGSHYWIFARPDEVLTPPDMPAQRNTSYELDTAVTQHGLHVAGTTAGWVAEIAEPLRGNSNVALALGTFFAAPMLRFASEPGGGNHFCGRSTIGKTMASAVGQSIYGWPFETADDNTFGVSSPRNGPALPISGVPWLPMALAVSPAGPLSDANTNSVLSSTPSSFSASRIWPT
jgi:hypothetical protein